MIISERKLKELSSVLEKGNNIIISEAIDLLRGEQPFEGAVGLLTSLYNETEDYTVRKSIEGFMNDLKDKSVRREVMTEIRKPWKPDTICMMVSSCWQSGLDYSEYSLDLAEVFFKADYLTALECFTVIEESVQELTREGKDKIIKIIGAGSLSPVNEKTTLTLELISILERE